MDEHELVSTAMRLLVARRIADATCEVCGTTFTGHGGRYCSRRCRNRAYTPIRYEQRRQQREATHGE